MTNYEKIRKIIEAGHMALVQKNNGEMMIAYAISETGELVCTNWQRKMSRLWNWDCVSWDIWCMWAEYWKHVNITVYQPPLHYYKPWDLVEILPSIKDTIENGTIVLEAWWKYKVIEDEHNLVWIGDWKGNVYVVSHRHIAPRIRDEPKQETFVWKEIKVTIDGKEYKVKVIE